MKNMKRMKYMKRMLPLLLALILALPLCLSGCGEREAGPLRILLDVSGSTKYNRTSGVVKNLLDEIAAQGGPADVEVEYLPQTGRERENAVTHLRTEIMAGGGPDLFIISSNYWSDGEQPGDGPLFPFPEKSMVNGLFLPLDKYIENAQFAMWGEFNQTVLEVGRTDKGQVLVPLSYTFPVACFPRFDVSHGHSTDLTWDDMLAGENLVMKAAAMLESGSRENMLQALDNPNFDAIFGKTADYKAEELLFSQEEFTDYTHKQLALYDENPESLAELPEYFHTYAHPWFPQDGGSLTVIPQYNKDGGVTATVFHYACINANSKRGGDAFFVLDYLLSRDGSFSGTDDNVYIPKESWRQDFYSLFTGETGLHIDGGMAWSSVYESPVSGENRSAMEAAVRCVTAVNVHGKLNKTMADMLSECEMMRKGRKEGDPDELIRETYRVMQMELQES